jgi:hypothetical protein
VVPIHFCNLDWTDSWPHPTIEAKKLERYLQKGVSSHIGRFVDSGEVNWGVTGVANEHKSMCLPLMDSAIGPVIASHFEADRFIPGGFGVRLFSSSAAIW